MQEVAAQIPWFIITPPIGVSAYKLTHSLPKQIKGQLPTIEELEKELGGKKRE